MKNNNYKYSKKEIDFIKENYPKKGSGWCSRQLNIPKNKIVAKANYLNIKMLNRGSYNKLNKKIFIERSIEKHNYKYDYSLVEYNNQYEKIEILCPIHGLFKQTAKNHMLGKGCSSCGGSKQLTTEEFIEKSRKIHGDKYDYSLVNYLSNKIKVKIICPKHGDFLQKPNSHLSQKQGCSMCSVSKGEMLVTDILNNLNIKYEKQKTFPDCIHKQPLRFDFYLPYYNLCLEYDGIQHFKPHFKDYNGNGYEYTKKCDKIKNKYCVKNGIPLVRIKYDNTFTVVNGGLNFNIKNFVEVLANGLTQL